MLWGGKFLAWLLFGETWPNREILFPAKSEPLAKTLYESQNLEEERDVFKLR